LQFDPPGTLSPRKHSSQELKSFAGYANASNHGTSEALGLGFGLVRPP